MFNSEYRHSIDPKGRIIMPVKYREELGEVFMITRGFDDSLYVFPMAEWEIFSNKIQSLPLTNKNARQLTRHFLSGAVDCQLDKQGRILLPQHLREFAKIDKEVTIAGAGNKLEICATENWTDFLGNMDADAVAAALDAEGITL